MIHNVDMELLSVTLEEMLEEGCSPLALAEFVLTLPEDAVIQLPLVGSPYECQGLYEAPVITHGMNDE